MFCAVYLSFETLERRRKPRNAACRTIHESDLTERNGVGEWGTAAEPATFGFGNWSSRDVQEWMAK
jgi:hypothetical protein